MSQHKDKLNLCLIELYIGYNFIIDENTHLDKKKIITSDKYYDIPEQYKNNSLSLRQFIIFLFQKINDTINLTLVERTITDFYKKNKLFVLLSKLQNIPTDIYLQVLQMNIIQDCRIVLLEKNIVLLCDIKNYYISKWNNVCHYDFINKYRCFKNMLLFTKKTNEWLNIQFTDFYEYRYKKMNTQKVLIPFVNILCLSMREKRNDTEIEQFMMNNVDLLKYLANDNCFIKSLWNYLQNYNLKNSIFYQHMKIKFGNIMYRHRYKNKNCIPQICIIPTDEDKCYICMEKFHKYEHFIKCSTCIESVSHIYCSEHYGKCGFCRKKFRLFFSYFR